MGLFSGCGGDVNKKEKPKKKESKSGLSDATMGGRKGLMDEIFGDESYPEPKTTTVRKKKK